MPAAFALALLVPGTAAAGQVCTVSATDMAFGNYDPFAGGPLDSTSTISVTCMSVGDPRVRYEIRLSPGQSGAYNPRAMTNGTSQLNYNLFRNRNRTRIWGDGSSGTVVRRRNFRLAPVGTTRTRTETVRGRVFAGQNVSPGTYLDTITVTVFF
ncbi:MAG: spore coat U domain-containing protein [Kiloniellales bacterium]|nr:spore coat U domain-containing protein [Kiloniellales bacterium]